MNKEDIMKGKFVTFEGCEGVGKSTQINMLKSYLTDSNQEVMFLREPGGNVISEKIREVILSLDCKGMSGRCEAMLYSAARNQLVTQVILPALKDGITVVCDRFIDSSTAYQGYARGLGVELVNQLNKMACEGAIPDVTIFLDLPPQQSFKRKGGADADDRLENETMQFHQKVYEGYKNLEKTQKHRFFAIDASPDALSIHNSVIELLRKKDIIK